MARYIDFMQNIIVQLNGEPIAVESAEWPELGDELEHRIHEYGHDKLNLYEIPAIRFRRVRFDVLADKPSRHDPSMLIPCEFQNLYSHGIRKLVGRAFARNVNNVYREEVIGRFPDGHGGELQYIRMWIDTRIQYEMIVERGEFTPEGAVMRLERAVWSAAEA
jgi:hypothetical protein